MGKNDKVYFLEKDSNGKIIKIHCHVPGGSRFAREVSLVIQGFLTNRSSVAASVIEDIVRDRIMNHDLRPSEAAAFNDELWDTVLGKKGDPICRGGCS